MISSAGAALRLLTNVKSTNALIYASFVYSRGEVLGYTLFLLTANVAFTINCLTYKIYFFQVNCFIGDSSFLRTKESMDPVPVAPKLIDSQLSFCNTKS